jgi:hypothetical protein
MSIRRLSERARSALVVLGGCATVACMLHVSPAYAAPDGEAPSKEDPELDASRARFRKGMESYAAGDYSGAIVTWQGIYAELGRERGYRLAFNLGRAFDAFGDASRAAEHYAAYLDEVGVRRARGEALPELVEKQAVDAEARLAELVRTRGRLRVSEGKTPVAVRIDGGAPRLAGFVSLLTPGKHVVVFGEGVREERREIVIGAGEEKTLEPPPPAAVAPRADERRVAKPLYEERTVRPFSPVWIYVGAGASALSVILPVVQYANAVSLANRHDSSGDAIEREQLAAEYTGAKTGAYASLAVPIALGAATAGLGLAYVFGTKKETVRVGPAGPGLRVDMTF